MAGVSSWTLSLLRCGMKDSTRLGLHAKTYHRIFVRQHQVHLFSSTARTTKKLKAKNTPVSKLKEYGVTETTAQLHIPVLLNEILSTWIPPPRKQEESSSEEGEKNNTIYLVDGTVGGGGHALAALQSSPSIKLLAMDLDVASLDAARHRLSENGFEEDVRVSYWHGSYATIGEALSKTPGFPSRVDGILIDLGFGSAQLDDPNRGFSFRKEGPLDMRYDQSEENTFTARGIVNGWSVKHLEDLFLQSDEPMARIIAEEIVRWRDWSGGNSGKKRGFSNSTLELRHVIDTAVERTKQKSEEEASTSLARRNDPNLVWRPDERRGKFVSKSERRRILRRFQETKPKNPQALTRCFQALRIEVNREMDHIHDFFCEVGNHLQEEGRLAVLSFHPNEDAIVEDVMNKMCASSDVSSEGERDDGRSIDKFEMITIDPIRPSKEEVKMNRRARSARLRSIKCVGVPSRESC